MFFTPAVRVLQSDTTTATVVGPCWISKKIAEKSE